MAKILFDNGPSQIGNASANSSYLGSAGRFIPNIVRFLSKKTPYILY